MLFSSPRAVRMIFQRMQRWWATTNMWAMHESTSSTAGELERTAQPRTPDAPQARRSKHSRRGVWKLESASCYPETRPSWRCKNESWLRPAASFRGSARTGGRRIRHSKAHPSAVPFRHTFMRGVAREARARGAHAKGPAAVGRPRSTNPAPAPPRQSPDVVPNAFRCQSRERLR